jgi:flavin reductase (DIM6/NTAB) family NADH-FMN oxidoreductase RutF
MANEGILLAATDSDGRLNPMTIGWGVFGWIWGRAIFTVLVRPSRFTYRCIEASGDFTVNVQPGERKDLASFCGSVSGRDCDKMSKLELTALPSRHIRSAGIAECPIVFECAVVHRNNILPPELIRDITSSYYAEGDFHRLYFGQILRISVDQALLKKLSHPLPPDHPGS